MGYEGLGGAVELDAASGLSPRGRDHRAVVPVSRSSNGKITGDCRAGGRPIETAPQAWQDVPQ